MGKVYQEDGWADVNRRESAPISK